MPRYSNSFVVSKDDLDENNHVNNVRYVEWIQDVAKDHWFSCVNQQIEEQYYWVVRKHEITYSAQAFLNDPITANTYVELFKGPVSKRIVEIRNTKTNQLLVKAITNWCMMDRTTNKPAKVPPAIIELF